MRWHHRPNYHNSRYYDDDPADEGGAGHAKTRLARLAAAARKRLRALIGPSARPDAADIMLNMGLTRGYTMLGLTEREVKASAPKTVLWPISERGPRVVRSQYGHRADNSSSHLGAR